MRSSEKETWYWVAHSRGADFADLDKKGFLTFYPMMDDYVFLEVGEKNKKWLVKQEELRVRFVKRGKDFAEVSSKSLLGLYSSTTDRVSPGMTVTVVKGYCESLTGIVRGREGDLVKVDLKGYKRVYSVELPLKQVVLSGEVSLDGREDEDSSG